MCWVSPSSVPQEANKLCISFGKILFCELVFKLRKANNTCWKFFYEPKGPNSGIRTQISLAVSQLAEIEIV